MGDKVVTIISKDGGIGMGIIDEEGYLIVRAGHFYPSTTSKVLDKEFRRDVAKIIKDDGVKYREVVRGLNLPSTYKDVT